MEIKIGGYIHNDHILMKICLEKNPPFMDLCNIN